MSTQTIKSTYQSALKNERHYKVAETRYWCDQYRMLAKWAIEELERKAITTEESSAVQEFEPRFGQGISDNPYCNDFDSNEPNSRAMRWHNKLLSLDANPQPKAEQECCNHNCNEGRNCPYRK